MCKTIGLLSAVALALFILTSPPTGCGTCVGNPECVPGRDSAPMGSGTYVDVDFAGPIRDYSQSTAADCGAFTELSDAAAVEAGRACIRLALATCNPSKYLLNETTSSQAHFVSFVGVEYVAGVPGSCDLRVHTASSDTARFVGDSVKTCPTLDPAEPIELACDIGN